MGLYYVGIRVTNLRRSLRFYTRVLGLRESIRGDFRRAGKGIWVGLTDPRTHRRLELNWYPPGSTFGTRYQAGEALDHIGFFLGRVSRRRLEVEYQRLLTAGAGRTLATPEASDGWQACVTDPDGNWIEIFRFPTAGEERAARPRRSRRRGPRRAGPRPNR